MMITGSSAKIEGMAGVSPSTRRGRVCAYMHARARMHSRALVNLMQVQTQDVSRTDTGCLRYRHRMCHIQTKGVSGTGTLEASQSCT